ncbi:inhibin alpha chain [Cololabis saira]|uniref:inhibin alpha chain n=1 Tax=Cololabis saira TaxID=129043 RepID=UPI002AD4E984|nr:inhibin alpha chain [Cololabis saira]
MLSCAVFILGPLWVSLIQTCRGEELSREVVLSWFRERVLEELGVKGPPLAMVQGPDRNVAQLRMRHLHTRVLRTRRSMWVNRQTSPDIEKTQMILFPSSDSSCAANDSAGETTMTHLSFYFQPSINFQNTVATSAHFWLYVGEGAAHNSSGPLFMVSTNQQLLPAAAAPSMSSDGWGTYSVDQSVLVSLAEGPFLLQVHCTSCQSHNSQPDKTPFLSIHVRPRGPVRSPRHAPLTIPWSPSAIYLLQRPSQEMLEHGDCHRAGVEISFEELGWDNWIVDPKVLTFYYCHGNCSAGDRTMARLGMAQCCAPVPGTMKSLKITTTSDGGYSFNIETLPNIIPEVCACI